MDNRLHSVSWTQVKLGTWERNWSRNHWVNLIHRLFLQIVQLDLLYDKSCPHVPHINNGIKNPHLERKLK